MSASETCELIAAGCVVAGAFVTMGFAVWYVILHDECGDEEDRDDVS